MSFTVKKSRVRRPAFKRFTLSILVAAIILVGNTGWSADIATWGPTGWSGTAASPLAAASKDANLTSASLARSGLTGTTSSSRYSSSGWNTTANYLTITLTPASGYTLNLNSGSLVGAWGSSGTGPGSYVVYSSVVSYTTSIGTFTSVSSGQSANQTINLPSSGFNSLSSITFRIVGSATTVSGGTTASSGTGGPSYVDVTGAVVPPAPSAPTASAATSITSSSFKATGPRPPRRPVIIWMSPPTVALLRLFQDTIVLMSATSLRPMSPV